MGFKIKSNAAKVASQLKEQINSFIREGSSASVVVSYDTAYAVYVHEDLTHKDFSKAGTGPKFLEEPARMLASSGALGREFQQSYQGGMSLRQSVFQCGLKVAGASVEVCPVDTSELVKSLKVRYDEQIGFNKME